MKLVLLSTLLLPTSSFLPTPTFTPRTLSPLLDSKTPFTTPSTPTSPLPTGTEAPMETTDANSLEELRPVDIGAYRLGNSDGQDAPVDVAWRLAAEEMFRASGESVGVAVDSVTWSFCKVTVTVPSGTTADQQDSFVSTARGVFDEAELEGKEGGDVLTRCAFTVQTPGVKGEIETQAQ